MTEVELLTQPGCGPCIAAKRMLEGFVDEHPISLTVRNIREDEDAAEIIRNSQYGGTPVVVIGDTIFHGMDRDAIVAAIRAKEVLF